ncbi:MAG TPA: HlyD family secretion protein [Terriglobia bacterium]|nr:HlyD family secretion protein [Terriglobia bacterium]
MAQRAEIEEQKTSQSGQSRISGARAGVNEADMSEVNGKVSNNTKPGRKWLIVAAVIAAVAVSVLVWRHYAGWESTDDAVIDGHIYPISARVGGHVLKVTADNNQYVEAGTVLVELDPKDYQVAVDRAAADLANAEAAAQGAQVGVPITSVSTSSQLSVAGADVESAQAGVISAEKEFAAAQAKVQEAEANNAKAQADLKRYAQLIGKQEISRQQYDQAVAAAESAAATVAAMQASAAAAQSQEAEARGKLAQTQAQLRSSQTGPQQVAVTRSRAEAADAMVKTAQAALEQAQLNLRYTTIVAPVSGIVGKKSVEAGQNVQAGEDLMAVVPLNDTWVTANFKETQLKQMRPGQPVKIHVDAYGRDYTGRVLNLAAATGAEYSLLPPENATGNYVKVVQRVPVKIVFDEGQDPDHLLRVGMSVEPSVRVN